MGALDSVAQGLLLLTRAGLDAVQAGGHHEGQLHLKQLQVETEQLQNELEREYRRGHWSSPTPTPRSLGPSDWISRPSLSQKSSLILDPQAYFLDPCYLWPFGTLSSSL